MASGKFKGYQTDTHFSEHSPGTKGANPTCLLDFQGMGSLHGKLAPCIEETPLACIQRGAVVLAKHLQYKEFALSSLRWISECWISSATDLRRL